MEDGQNKSKMIFCLYCPDSLGIAKKIPYTSSALSMQNAAPHTSHLQINDYEELVEQAFAEKL